MTRHFFIVCGCLLLLVTQAQAEFQFELQALASNEPACREIAPFYWEMGNRNGPLYSGQVGRSAPGPNTVMPIASATKWLFGAYVMEQRQGQLDPQDILALTMRSGYTGFRHQLCIRKRPDAQEQMTVAECFGASRLLRGRNDAFNSDHLNKFNYSGGHFQHWGVQNGLAEFNNAQLERSFSALIGKHSGFVFNSPQLAGGVATSAHHYRAFLLKLMTGELRLGRELGEISVCANPVLCPQQALSAPLPDNLPWRYGLGYWIEVDSNPNLHSTQRIYSSAGLFGFYPWVTEDKQFYGIIARHDRALLSRPGVGSALCGKALREALLTRAKPAVAP